MLMLAFTKHKFLNFPPQKDVTQKMSRQRSSVIHIKIRQSHEGATVQLNSPSDYYSTGKQLNITNANNLSTHQTTVQENKILCIIR